MKIKITTILMCISFNALSYICPEGKQLGLIYLNGVLVPSEIKAEKSTAFIGTTAYKGSRTLAGLDKDKVCFKTAYNTSHGLNDALEVIGQKFKEELGDDFKWSQVAKYIHDKESLGADILNNSGLSDKLLDADALKLLEGQEQETMLTLTDKVGAVLLQYPTVLVSHSQGNLFANNIYTELVKRPSLTEQVKIKFANLQVATPVAEVKAPIGAYYTHPDDLIIVRSLNLLGGFPIEPPNFGLYNNGVYRDLIGGVAGIEDPTKHFLVETYVSDEVYASFDKNWIKPKPLFDTVYSGDGTVTEIFSGKFKGLNGEVLSLSQMAQISKLPPPQNIFKTTEEVFYEKLNALAEQVLREPEPIVLNTSKLCLDDNKVDFQIGVSDNFISIELGSVILNETGLEISRTVTKKYEKLSELPNPIISERTKMAHFDHTHSSRTKNEHFFVKACTRTECREEQFSVEHPEYKLTYSEDDEEQLDNANLISSGGLDGVIRKEQRTKFEVVGTPGGYTLFPAYYVGCYIGNVGFDENGNYIKGVGAHFFDYGIYDMIRADLITSAEDTIDIIFTSDNKNCEDKEKYVEKRFTVVRPACEYELKKAAELNAANQ
jgi:hypothetical protein